MPYWKGEAVFYKTAVKTDGELFYGFQKLRDRCRRVEFLMSLLHFTFEKYPTEFVFLFVIDELGIMRVKKNDGHCGHFIEPSPVL